VDPAAHICELRTRVRMRKTLIDQRTAWQQRLQAQLFQQGVPAGQRLRSQAGREALAAVELSPAGRELVALGLRMIDALDRELAPLDRELSAFARRQPGCRALIAGLYGARRRAPLLLFRRRCPPFPPRACCPIGTRWR
jgi:transposase